MDEEVTIQGIDVTNRAPSIIRHESLVGFKQPHHHPSTVRQGKKKTGHDFLHPTNIHAHTENFSHLIIYNAIAVHISTMC